MTDSELTHRPPGKKKAVPSIIHQPKSVPASSRLCNLHLMPGSYPPNLNKEDLHALRDTAIDYALANGLVVRPTVDKQVHFANNAAVTHAPISLFPTPFRRAEFEKAKRLQPIWNDLIHKLSQDDAFLNEIMETYVYLAAIVLRVCDSPLLTY